MCFAFMCFDLWFHSEAHPAEDEVQLRHRVDAEDTIWFVAPAREQLALVTGGGFHGFPFVEGEVAEGVGNAPTSV